MGTQSSLYSTVGKLSKQWVTSPLSPINMHTQTLFKFFSKIWNYYKRRYIIRTITCSSHLLLAFCSRPPKLTYLYLWLGLCMHDASYWNYSGISAEVKVCSSKSRTWSLLTAIAAVLAFNAHNWPKKIKPPLGFFMSVGYLYERERSHVVWTTQPNPHPTRGFRSFQVNLSERIQGLLKLSFSWKWLISSTYYYPQRHGGWKVALSGSDLERRI